VTVNVATAIAILAAAGAVASFIAGAVLYARAFPNDNLLGRLSIVVWPFAIARARRLGGEPAANVNKALVAFIACMLVGTAAFSASTNLHRFAR
jgi:hypothetical protein